jgi:hypothetical protein
MMFGQMILFKRAHKCHAEGGLGVVRLVGLRLEAICTVFAACAMGIGGTGYALAS